MFASQNKPFYNLAETVTGREFLFIRMPQLCFTMKRKKTEPNSSAGFLSGTSEYFSFHPIGNITPSILKFGFVLGPHKENIQHSSSISPH